MKMTDNETFTVDGLTFRYQVRPDEFGRKPWDDDGHGPVSDWTTRDKKPGERVLVADRASKRYYDFAVAVEKARAEQWDAEPCGIGTVGERAVRAVEADFARMRAWCNDQWSYVGVVVVLLDVSGRNTQEMESLWGIESDDESYLAETARELAGEISARVTGIVVCQTVRTEAVTHA